MPEMISVDVDGPIATITLSRPPMNALCMQMQQEIAQASRDLGARSDVRAVIVYGGPKLFAAGADVKEMAGMTYQDMVRAASSLQDAFTAVTRIPQPTIAAVTGFALGGGCELAMCCDLRIAADDAKFGQPEILLGIIPGAGGTQRLPRLVGVGRAKDIILTGRFVSAGEALEIGLANKVVPAEETYAAAVELATRLARGPALALRAAKETIDRGIETDLETGLAIERQQFAALFATEDQTIGMSSFIENGPGKAQFTGN